VENFKAGIVQMNSGPDVEENMRAVREYTAYAAAEGAKFIMFPETVDYIGAQMGKHAERIPGYVTRTFAGLARRHGVYIHCGSITEAAPGGRPFNTTLLFAPDGQIRALYRKLHLFDVELENGPSFRESDEIAPGSEIVVAEPHFASLGLSICYDIRFPELYRMQAQSGAEVLCVAANFTRETGEKHWETLLRARAVENTSYVLAAGQCGMKRAFEAYGHSMIIDPLGEIVAEAGEEPEVLIAELDRERLENARMSLPCLIGRRQDVYQISGRIQKY